MCRETAFEASCNDKDGKNYIFLLTSFFTPADVTLFALFLYISLITIFVLQLNKTKRKKLIVFVFHENGTIDFNYPFVCSYTNAR